MDQALVTTTEDLPETLGWGLDADRENDPTYPMRHRDHDDGPGMTWVRPAQQPETVEVLRSIEHNRLPAVFGAAIPPSGLSGVIRRQAFKYSESQWAHWLLLMLADRINVVEGLAQDLSRGKVPNVLAERGIRSEWEFNKRGPLITGLMIGGAMTGVLAGAWLMRRRR